VNGRAYLKGSAKGLTKGLTKGGKGCKIKLREDKFMKSLLEIIASLMILFTGVPSVSYGSADYIYFHSPDEMYLRADVVLICTVQSSEVKSIDITGTPETDDDFIYTIATVKADEVFKGDKKPGDTLEVKQLGGFYDSVYYYNDGADYLTVGSKYLLFLSTYETSPASLLNQTQAMYYVSGSEITPREGNTITITYEQLLAE
jgi:hypothetical protein